jgi:hypothetical protein
MHSVTSQEGKPEFELLTSEMVLLAPAGAVTFALDNSPADIQCNHRGFPLTLLAWDSQLLNSVAG